MYVQQQSVCSKYVSIVYQRERELPKKAKLLSSTGEIQVNLKGFKDTRMKMETTACFRHAIPRLSPYVLVNTCITHHTARIQPTSTCTSDTCDETTITNSNRGGGTDEAHATRGCQLSTAVPTPPRVGAVNRKNEKNGKKFEGDNPALRLAANSGRKFRCTRARQNK